MSARLTIRVPVGRVDIDRIHSVRIATLEELEAGAQERLEVLAAVRSDALRERITDWFERRLAVAELERDEEAAEELARIIRERNRALGWLS